MSTNNFIPELWAGGILKERNRVLIAEKHCNTDYEGQIKQAGDRVKILQIAPVVSRAYVRNADIATPDQLTDADQYLDIDQGKYINVAIDDVDAAQASEKLKPEAERQIGLKMASDIDVDIFSLYSQAGVTLNGNAVTSANIMQYLAAAMQALQEADVPDGERKFLEVSPAIYNKLVNSRIAKETMNTKTIDGGTVETLYGFEISMSNNIAKTGLTSYCLARTKAAISYASQLTEIVPYKPEKRFGDGIKSLQVWGKKVIRPRELICLQLAIGQES